MTGNQKQEATYVARKTVKIAAIRLLGVACLVLVIWSPFAMPWFVRLLMRAKQGQSLFCCPRGGSANA